MTALLSPVLWANNTNAMLAAGITNSQTTITLTSGQGAQFPSPTGGAFFPLTLQSSSNALIYEITYCTARSGDTLTVTRGQEGTTALAFNAGDLAQNRPTAGTLNGGVLLNFQVFSTPGTATYTPTTGMAFVLVEVQSGGGGGGGCAFPSPGQSSVSCAGQGGHYGRGFFSAATVGASQTITVGAGGTAGAAGGSAGGSGSAGGQSSFGALIVQPGAGFGQGGGLYSSTATVLPSGLTVASPTNCFDWQTGGIPTGGTVVWFTSNYLTINGSFGGASRLSSIAPPAGLANGVQGSGWGAGGGSTGAPPGAPSGYSGGAGRQGIVLVWEFG
jgi:hypothetical protein